MDQDTLSRHILPKTKDTALPAFVSAKTKIDAMPECLAALDAGHFGCSLEDVDWGDAGTLKHYHTRLREFTILAFRECEHAT